MRGHAHEPAGEDPSVGTHARPRPAPIAQGRSAPASSDWLDARAVMRLQRLAGNATTAGVVARRQTGPTGAIPAPRHAGPPVQRQAAAPIDESAALVKAVQLVNRNSMAKVKLPIRAPAGIKVFGFLELKKLELELDIRGDLKSPQLSSTSSGTTLRGGAQNVSVAETDAADARRTEAKAAVYALELEQKFGASPFEEQFSWKLGVEHGRYTPTDALKPNKREFKGRLGFKVASEGFELEVEFVPIGWDAAKPVEPGKNPGFATFAVKIAKDFKTTLPRALNVGGTTVSATLSVKATGSAEVGPDYARSVQVLSRVLPKQKILEFLKAAAPAIAKEEAERFSQKLVTEMIEARTADILDPGVRALVRREASQKLAEDVALRELQLQLAEQCSVFIRREMTEEALSKLSIEAIGSAADDIAKTTARRFLTGAPQAAMLRQALGATIKQTIKDISLRSMARKAATSLIPGPADFVLILPEILFGYIDTVVKDQEIKTLGLRTLAARDNYVAGYTAALRGAAAGGGGGGAGGGNFEGAAQVLGLDDGAKMFDRALDLAGAHGGAAPIDELRRAVAELMAGLPVNRSQIVAAAAPKLKKMMMDAFEKKYSGGLLRTLFGGDFKDSKDYEYFELMIDTHLKEAAGNTTMATLRNGVKVPMVMLDATSDRAWYFRTMDGRFTNVTVGGDTKDHSGWITEDGTPLEDIYSSQEAANATKTEEAGANRVEQQRAALAQGVLEVEGVYNVLNFRITSVSLSGVPSDLAFQEFMRSPEFQGLTIAGSGVGALVSGSCTWSEALHDQLDDDVTVDFSARMRRDTAMTTVEHDSDHPELTAGGWTSALEATLLRDVGGRRFAQLPSLG